MPVPAARSPSSQLLKLPLEAVYLSPELLDLRLEVPAAGPVDVEELRQTLPAPPGRTKPKTRPLPPAIRRLASCRRSPPIGRSPEVCIARARVASLVGGRDSGCVTAQPSGALREPGNGLTVPLVPYSPHPLIVHTGGRWFDPSRAARWGKSDQRNFLETGGM
jgi:hypothetical protein